jgi:hypothetical protein
LRWLALREHPGEADWLCLDPIRLRFEQRSLVIDDPLRLELTEDESAGLAGSLAPVFSTLGKLEVVSAGIWNLRLLAGAPMFQPLGDSVGRIAAPLPPDRVYAPWRHAISEAQMLLHAHPVNQAREAAGRPSVNSLWPWGGGRLPGFDSSGGTNPHDALWSDDPVARGIACLLEIESAGLPPGFSGTAVRAPLAVFDALEQPARVGDGVVWRERLAHFESAWLAPALDALRRGRLDALRLLAPGDFAAAELHVTRHDMWKFWRKSRELSELAPE